MAQFKLPFVCGTAIGQLAAQAGHARPEAASALARVDDPGPGLLPAVALVTSGVRGGHGRGL